MEVVFDPNKPSCVECGDSFTPVLRKQGGGRCRIYCSSKCRANSWARRNTEKRKLSILKFEAKPVSKKKKEERRRQARYRKYKMTEDQVLSMLDQQGFKCQGCETQIDLSTGRIDHCHKTQKVRGVLCDHCNWSLGHARDNPEILRRLAKYLEQD